MITAEQAYNFGFEMGSEAVYQVIHRIKKENQYERYITIAAKEYVYHHWYRFDYYIEGAYSDDELVSQLW